MGIARLPYRPNVRESCCQNPQFVSDTIVALCAPMVGNSPFSKPDFASTKHACQDNTDFQPNDDQTITSDQVRKAAVL